MKREIKRIVSGIGMALFAGSLFVVSEIPKLDSVRQIGRLLLAQTGAAFVNGQDGQEAVAEMLGGQMYFYSAEESGEEQALVLAENEERMKSNLEEETETQAKVVGDV